MSAKRVLPADVYDTLEFSALAFGGIGGGAYFEYDVGFLATAPRCAFGHLAFSLAKSGSAALQLVDAENLLDRQITTTANDAAVGEGERISFDEWCRRLNVVRGAA